MREKQFVLLPDVDAKKKIKVDGGEFLAITKKTLKDRYRSESQYVIVGETKKKNKKDALGSLRQNDTELIVCQDREHSKLLYHTAGFLKVQPEIPGRDVYVRVLKHNFLIILLFFGILIGGICLGLWFSPPRAHHVDPPTPIAIDTTAETLPPSEDTAPTVDEGGGSVTMGYTKIARMDLQTKRIQLQFINPATSTHDIVVELYVATKDGEGIMIASSGRVPVNNMIRTLQFNDAIELNPGSYAAYYRVSFYNGDSGYKAKVDSVIKDVALTVK